jgi:hypothetical protein
MMMANANSGSLPDWLSTALGIGGGLGVAAGGAYNAFGNKGKSPGKSANEVLDQIPGQTKPYYQPYMDAGGKALGTIQGEYGGLLNGETQNKLGANYKESPGYKYLLQTALQGTNNAAAAGGMLGTPQHAEQNAATAEGIASQDYNNYINNQIGLYGKGLSGEEGLNEQGYNANKSYADQLAQITGQKASNTYADEEAKQKNKAGGLSDIFGGLGTAGASYLGGPAGGTAFKTLYDKFFGGK